MLHFTFLGTSAGVPTIQRNVTSLAIQTGLGKSWVMVDCGEATQHQLLRTSLSVHDLEAIFITHHHGDHCYGLPGVLASAAMHGRTKPLNLIAPQSVLDWVAATIDITTLYLTYELRTTAVEAYAENTQHCFIKTQDGGKQSTEIAVQAHALKHRVPSYAYAVTQRISQRTLDKEKLQAAGVEQGPLWGRLLNGEDIQLANGSTLHAADVVRNQSSTLRAVIGGDNADMSCLNTACQDTDVLIHESTYTAEIMQRVGNTPMHSCARDVAAFAHTHKIPHLILTHISPRYGSTKGEAELLAEARAHYEGKLHLAQDFAQYRLDKNGLRAIEAQ